MSLSLQLLASDGVQQSTPVTVTVTVLDANDNTPTFANVSYNVNLFTDMMPGETVLQVHTVRHTCVVFGTCFMKGSHFAWLVSLT